MNEFEPNATGLAGTAPFNQGRTRMNPHLSGRSALRRAFALAATLYTLGAWAAPAAAAGDSTTLPPRDLSRLTLLGPDYPRVFFFRAAEGAAKRTRTTYEEWEAEFGRLMGIMGKCLDEEVLGLDIRNPEWFTRFKRQHPNQTVLLHFNGNARDPRYHTEKYFSGHWIYRQAVFITADIPAEGGETVIRVENARDFKVGAGRYQTSNDDIALFGLGANRTHDWNHCEQVQLVAVDLKANTLRVKRGCYGTKPLAFKAGQARAAAHQAEGPWGKNNHLLWFYNFATHCPQDARGRTSADLLVEDLVAWFGPGGKLAAFDGLEFDVMGNDTRGDTDGDGELDNGVIGGVNRYGIGMNAFARQLRARLGDNFIIQGDGALGPGGRRSQRAWGILNGIESEGWPNLNQWEMDDWSGGLNRHFFWSANARSPVFNYINHKWVQPVPGKPGEHASPDVPFARHRLAFAAAQFTDAMLCYSFAPAREADGKIGVWDEFRRGRDNTLGWLGQPEGPAVHVAAATPDLLAGSSLAPRIRGRVTVRDHAGGLEVSAADPKVGELAFSLPGIAIPGGDVVVLVTMKGEPQPGYPREMARLAQVEMAGGGTQSLVGRAPAETGIGLRRKKESPLDPATGARVSYQTGHKIGERALDGYAIHPPYLGAKGYVYCCRDTDVAPDSELRFSLGMSEKSPARSDGVWFQVWVAEVVRGELGAYQKIFERATKGHAWVPCVVPLEAWSGKQVRFKFVADCGPQDNATTDQGFWGDVRIAAAGQPEEPDFAAKAYMTWVNDRPFQSVFYFRDVKARTLNLSFTVEGATPVTIQKVTLHAQPDAMFRVFEKGLVLANPSHRPFTFDLAALTPGRRYHRLQATANQDTQANNGAAVSGRITLGERDALFLTRDLR